MAYFDSTQRASKELAPGVHARTFWGEKLMFALVEVEPGAVVPSHSHPHEQAGLVLEGELEFEIAGERQTLKAGDIYTIPGDVEHSARALTQKARVLDVFTPAREEYKY